MILVIYGSAVRFLRKENRVIDGSEVDSTSISDCCLERVPSVCGGYTVRLPAPNGCNVNRPITLKKHYWSLGRVSTEDEKQSTTVECTKKNLHSGQKRTSLVPAKAQRLTTAGYKSNQLDQPAESSRNHISFLLAGMRFIYNEIMARYLLYQPVLWHAANGTLLGLRSNRTLTTTCVAFFFHASLAMTSRGK